MRRASVKKKSKKTVKRTDPASRQVDFLPVRKVSEMQQHRSYVFYGRSGTGKTTLASTFPKPVLLLDVNDQGTDSIADHEDINVRDIREWDEFELTYWYLMQHQDEYRTIVIDTVSALQGVCINHVLAEKNKDSERAGEWGVMTKQEWGQAASLLKIWITRLRDLPMEVVFIAQDRTFNLDEEGDPEQMLDPEVGPQLMPSVVKHLNAAVHLIANTFIRERISVRKVGNKKKEVKRIQFCARLGPNPVYITKVRKPKSVVLPSIIVDPSYEGLQRIIKGEE